MKIPPKYITYRSGLCQLLAIQRSIQMSLPSVLVNSPVGIDSLATPDLALQRDFTYFCQAISLTAVVFER